MSSDRFSIHSFKGNETTGPAPVAKPRTKLDGEAEKQKKVIADLEHSNASLKAERDEVGYSHRVMAWFLVLLYL